MVESIGKRNKNIRIEEAKHSDRGGLGFGSETHFIRMKFFCRPNEKYRAIKLSIKNTRGKLL